jgi:hypothetical protein
MPFRTSAFGLLGLSLRYVHRQLPKAVRMSRAQARVAETESWYRREAGWKVTPATGRN